MFAGIGGFRIAADQHRIQTVWANDISSQACKVYRSRFGDTELDEGDIREVKESIPPHDLLTAGFPCQPFSSAGKKKGIHDSRGTLFQEIVDVLARCQPRYFILENVKRLLTMDTGVHFATILSSLAELNYQIEWRLLNAMHLGLPQNRQRVFIIGVRQNRELLDDLAVRMATAVDLARNEGNLRHSIWDAAGWRPIERHGVRFPSWGMAASGRFIAADLESFSSAMKPIMIHEVMEPDVAKEFDFTESTLKWIESNSQVNRLVQGVEILSNQAGGARMGYTIFGINGVAPTLTSTTSRHYERYKVGDRFRRLTNVEYARIQGFPDNHCASVSVYDQYALFGNAVPPPMAHWVMNRILAKGIGPNDHSFVQKDLFSDAYERAIT